MATDTAVPEATARRIGVPHGMDRALARIRSPQGEVVGSGFLVDARHVATCTHVVLRAAGRGDRDTVRDGDTVAVDFPLVAPDVLIPATSAVSRDLGMEGGDVTVLALADEPPPGLEPARLIVADDVWGHPFRAFGHPRRLDQGVWASGVLRAPQGDGWVQMEAGASGYAVEAGFSGGAVWDDELAGVVGMTVAADARPDLRAAFLIPATVLIQAWPGLRERTLPPCPYRGLYPFRPSDTELFFGREDVTDRLVREVARRPLLAVVGPSGSGKSSVVSAGVVPRLKREHGWMCLSMRPAQASSPLFALAAAFVPALEPDLGETERLSAANALAAVLRDGRLPDVVDRVLARAQLDHLLLIVDQMEELFAREQGEVSAFSRALLSAVRRGDGRRGSLTVLLTLRADFLGNALQHSGLAEALEDSVITIGQMRREQLRAVIEGPLPPGVRYEAGLVERILGDVGDEPGSLPLLEFALTLLWERQQGGLLTHSAYQELGGVDGALASYAERVYSDQLLPEDQEEVRRLFIQLVRPTEVGSSVRRVARRSELGEPRWQLGQRLAATRLLVADRDAAGAESVELVHEALIDGWARLQQWTKADQAFRAWQEQLRAAMAAWESVRRDSGGLLRGAFLADAERWLQERPNDLGETERQFIRASQARRGRSVRRLRITVAALTVLLLLATGLGGFAYRQSTRLGASSRLVGSRSLLSQAEQLDHERPDLAMLLAAAAYRMAQTPEAAGAVTRMAGNQRQVDTLLNTSVKPVLGVEFDPTGSDLVRLYGPNTITVWDIRRASAVHEWGSEGLILSTASSANGRAIAVQEKVLNEVRLAVWFPAEDRTIRISDPGVASDTSLNRTIMSPDGAMLAACTPEHILVWDVGTQRLLSTITGKVDSCGMGFTTALDLAYVDGREIHIWNLAENRVAVRAPVPATAALGPNDATQVGLTAAPDGGLALVDDGTGSMYWWDLRTLGQLERADGPTSSGDVSFTPDGRWAAIGAQNAAMVFDMSTRKAVKVFTERAADPIYSMFTPGRPFALSPDGRRIAFPAGGSALALMDIDGGGDLPTPALHIAVKPDSADLVTLNLDGEVTEQPEVGPGRLLIPGSDSTDYQDQHALSPSGRYAATQRENSDELLVADALHPQQPPIRLSGSGAITSAAFDPVNDQFVAWADTAAITVWSLDAGAPHHRVLLPPNSIVAGMAVDAVRGRAATYDPGGHAQLWDLVTGRSTALPIEGVHALSFSPDGRWLSLSTDTEVHLWDLTLDREQPQRFSAATSANDFFSVAARFSPDGQFLAAPTEQDGSAILVWRVADGRLLGAVSGYASDFAFLPGNQRLVVAANGVFTTEFDPEWARRTICRVVKRDLTSDEWHQYAEGLDRVTVCP
jgi:WD40 repeat protein